MRPFRFACAVALGSGSCAFVAEIGGSSVVNGDEHGGTVSHVTTFTITGDEHGGLVVRPVWALCRRDPSHLRD